MTPAELLQRLTTVAAEKFDGHFTAMKFTTNWRVGFGTPMFRCDIHRLWTGKTFAEAAERALAARENNPDCELHRWFEREGCPACPECGQPLAQNTCKRAS